MARLIVCMTGISIAGKEKYEPAESFGRRSGSGSGTRSRLPARTFTRKRAPN